MTAPTVVSTFAGCGGSSLGYKLAGFRCRLAVEWDGNAVETYRANFPTTPVHHGDIAQLTVEQILEKASLAPGELDVFDGSPPCQGFSTAGQRNIDDPRNGLFREYVRLLRGLKPRAFVMENVKGLTVGKMRLVFSEIVKELEDSGYVVRAAVLNAASYGTPQRRERVIFLGARKDLGVVPTHPPPTRLVPVACELACNGLAGTEPHETQRAWLLTECATRGAFREYDQIPMGRTLSNVLREAKGFNARRLHALRPASTITKNDGNIGLHGHMHWSERRRCTIPELKRLAGFPDEFIFEGEWSDACARIGNCVPPPLMRAVAEHVVRTVLTRETSSTAPRERT